MILPTVMFTAACTNGMRWCNDTTEGAQGICPEGWIPTDAEWKTMEMSLGMSQSEADGTGWRGTDEGNKMKEAGTVHWAFPNTGATNSSGFTILPVGLRYNYGLFGYLGGLRPLVVVK